MNLSIADIESAQGRLRDLVLPSPIVRLDTDHTCEIYLKLENLQPLGSFKLRGAGSAISLADPSSLAQGVVTASAGNMAQGVAWHARRLRIPCTVIVPDSAPQTKLAAVNRLGATVVSVPRERWWEIVRTRNPDVPGFFVHPVSDPAVIAGNGTIGLELMAQLDHFDTVIVPYGGGGLAAGIAMAIKAYKPSVQVYACELDHVAPFAAALAAGKPVTIDYKPSFVDGIGASQVLSEMWPFVRDVLNGSLPVRLAEIAAAIRLLLERHRILAEGAGAAAVAAAIAGRAGPGRLVCIVSGGNIDTKTLQEILAGKHS